MDFNLLRRFSAGSPNDEKNVQLWFTGASLFINQIESLINKTDPNYKLEFIDILSFKNENSCKLDNIFKNNNSDKSTGHDYHHLYSYILNNLNNKNLNILEIGLGTNNPELISSMGVDGRPGASLYSFKEYLPYSNIYGADIDKNILFNEDRIKTCYVDQLDIHSFNNIKNQFGNIEYDLIIDNGLHSIGANLNTLLFALENIKVNGWIVIEDIHIPFNWYSINYILSKNNKLKTYFVKSGESFLYCIQKLPNEKINKILETDFKNIVEYKNTKVNIIKNLPKTIFILWLQGWDKAPWLQKQVVESWKINNPEWNIELVDFQNLKHYVNDIDYIYDNNKTISPQTKSDIIRLSLLKNHGGVWADSTMLCMQPLDHWVHEAVEPGGFWMYHGHGADMPKEIGPAIWFIISKIDNYNLQKWKEESDIFWKNNNITYNYFWMDSLFKNLFYKDNKFRDLWLKVPYLYCEEKGSSATLSHFGMENNNQDLKDIFKHSPPYALKFCNRWNTIFPNVNDEKCKISNGYYALEMSKRKYIKKHNFKNNIQINNNITIVVARYNENIEWTKQFPNVIIYNKGTKLDGDYNEIMLDNVGREGHTYYKYICDNYDKLDDYTIFLQGNPFDHSPEIIKIINYFLYNNDIDIDFKYLTNNVIETSFNNEKINHYQCRNIYNTYEKVFGNKTNNKKIIVGWGGLFIVSKKRILKRPKTFYENIVKILDYSTDPLEGYDIERFHLFIFS